MSKISRAFLCVFCLTAVSSGLFVKAIEPPAPAGLDQRVRRLAPVVDELVPVEAAASPTAGLDRFRSRTGGIWWGSLVAGSGRAGLISGSGMQILPIGGDSTAGLPDLEQRVRSFIATWPELLAPGAAELVLSTRRSAVHNGGLLAYVDFDLQHAGRPVHGAQVFARINHGRVIQFGTVLVGGEFDTDQPVLSLDQATAALFEYVGGKGELDALFGEQDLYYLPVRSGSGLEYRLVYEIAFRRGGEAATWTGRVGAVDGQVLEFFDANLYGEVTGGTYERTVTDPEVVRPFFDAQLGDGTVTDRAGYFDFGGGTASTVLGGRYFRMACDGCTNPAAVSTETDLGLGWLRLGTGGADEVGNGISTVAERNAFYHLTMIRLQATKWLSLGWLDTTITTNVNIADTCNAFWNGTANFYRSGGGCNNTGEIADVMQHEWGHGLDGNTLSGDSATGEGTADHVAFILQHHSVIGPYFRTTGGGVRDVNKDTSPRGLMTYSNVLTKCGTGPCLGPLGRECHCEGEIYGQAGWDLAQLLVARHGYHTGWQEFERLFYTSLAQSGTYEPNLANSIYDAMLAADDDDGNLANGTPNGQEIYDAYNLHEIAGSPVGSSPYCSRPAEPVVTVDDTCGTLELSWDAVPGAVEYRVMRQPLSDTKAFLPVATVTETFYSDDQVAPGATYYYVVEALDPGQCRSTIENVQTVTGPQKPLIGITALRTDDLPAGNRSGTVDPGEAVDLFFTLENISSLGGTGITGTMSTTAPGVTLDIASHGFNDLAPGAVTENDTGLRFSLDETVTCGDTLDFTFTATDDSACAVDTQQFGIQVGVDDIRQSDTFDTDNGWVFDAVGSTATSGAWTRGDPDPSGYQPGDDSDDAGTLAWFTAPNAGGDGVDDVDDGEVVLLSPQIDLSTMTRPRVGYQRWYANRDIGEDPDDYFWVEASDNDGSTWVTVEKLGSDVNAPAWTAVSFDLAGLISFTSQVRFRVRVSDGTLDGNLIEGALDDFKITEPVCDLTPPCFVEPAFTGLDGVSPGPDCAEVSLSWSAASTNCQNAEISYSIYRSTDPAFQPSAANRIAEGITGLSFTDNLLQPGQTYHYIARAMDTRSGEDSNLVRVQVASPVAPDTKAPVFNGLVNAGSGAGCGEAVLVWDAALETCSTPVQYRVYRSTTAGFTPGPATLVAETSGLGLVDAGLAPNQDYHYIVQAVDSTGLADGNVLERPVTATVLPEVLSLEDFEGGAAGWSRTGLNDAVSGLWELGDPAGTAAQPDSCASGVSCWVTGLAGPGLGDNDIDTGTTTLLSGPFSLLGMAEPAVRYMRYYSNDTGSTPGTDTWTVEISSDDGGNWTVLEQTMQSDSGLVHTQVELPLPGGMTATDTMRLQFTAADLADGSLVEAELDDFQTVDLAGGCDDCAAPQTVGTIFLNLDGGDIVLDWTADVVTADRFKVYALNGADFSVPTLIGTSDGKSFRHAGGALTPGLTGYRVSAMNGCAEEGALK